MDITFKDVSYIYDRNTPIANLGLKDVNLTIHEGSYTAIVGHTGSGKSTLLQHLNALLKPSEGTVTIGDRVINNQSNNKNLKPLRKQVGIVFQFAEHQLFEETVGKDIAFGPMNFGISEAESLEIAHEILKTVGLPDKYFNVSPFDLSGGQMRRVAIAGVLALKPSVLVLDEPTAGLDPKSRTEMMTLFNTLHEQQNLTIILVTHQMDDVANYADHVLVLEKGQVIRDTTPKIFFNEPEFVIQHGLGLPKATEFAVALKHQGFTFETLPMTEAALISEIAQELSNKGK